ncbi:4427_t:CDS:2 [Paraglomus brasilianum]|uniref:4427_t:CDS:1 n=1 Tax=Paraglomus brasilianum TaxID=144538 RepID=A0A9N9B8S2_9GLOM|nr:4427_t:CDS:2 [Paraglomus brasilianum]
MDPQKYKAFATQYRAMNPEADDATIVDRFQEQDLLSESDFLKLCPPPLSYINRARSTGTTNSMYACMPKSVITWDDFEDNVNNTTWDGTPKYSCLEFQQYLRICNEESVREALNQNVFRFLNILLEQHEVFDRHASLENVIGEPDFIQKDLNVLHLIIEVKTKWALSTDDLVTMYAQNLVEHITSPISVYNQLKQVFGYLSHNHLQFGALTTYDKTWFLYRPLEEPSQLHVSPAIQYNNQQPTLFQCLFYLTSLAHNKHNCDSAPSLPLPSQPHDDDPSPDDDNGDSSYDDGGQNKKQKSSKENTRRRNPKRNCRNKMGDKGGKRIKTITCPSHPLNGEEEHVPLEFFDWGSFRVLNILGKGHTGTVFKAILHGEMVALKICDLWQHPDYEKELLNEVKVYNALKDLQGDCIPRFKGAGYTAGGLFAIATDIVGRPLEDVESLSKQEHLVIQTALESIHHHGFVHNDICEDNILIKHDGCQFYAFFIDFAFSKQGCQHDFQKEMKSLARLLRQL